MSTVTNFIRENLGFRGTRNIAAWGVAGALAYYIWIRPERLAEQERRAARERARRFAEENGTLEIDRIRPIPDQQIGGLRKGNR